MQRDHTGRVSCRGASGGAPGWQRGAETIRDSCDNRKVVHAPGYTQGTETTCDCPYGGNAGQGASRGAPTSSPLRPYQFSDRHNGRFELLAQRRRRVGDGTNPSPAARFTWRY